MTTSRRRFGYVRRLPSRRWHASFIGPNGHRQNAPHTFATKGDADRWLSRAELDIARGEWAEDEIARTKFGDYARQWLEDNTRIGPRWRETCQRNLRLHLAAIDGVPLKKLTLSAVRRWHADAQRGSGGKTSIAQSYRFMRAVLNTAVVDGVIAKNPCQIPGAATPRARRRKVATPAQIQALVGEIREPYRAAVLLAAWGGLRRGEILALSPEDVDLDAVAVSVHRTQTEMLSTRDRFDAPPKSDAGYRTVALPPHVVPVLKEHLQTHAGANRLFISRSGGPMHGDTLYQAYARVRGRVGLDELSFHDLRHTGQTLAAATGATLADLMKRLGHSSSAAALRYLHTVNGRDEAIAEALSVLAEHGDAARLPKRLGSR